MKINPKLLERLSQSNINTDSFCKKLEESSLKKSVQPEQFLGCTSSNFRVRVLNNEDNDQSQKKIDAMSTATSGFFKAPDDMANSIVKSRIIKMQQSMVQPKQINIKPPQPKRPLVLQRPSSQGPKPQIQLQQQSQPKVLNRILIQRGSLNKEAIISNNNSNMASNNVSNNNSFNNPTQGSGINLRKRIMTARQEEEKPLKMLASLDEEAIEEITKKSPSEFFEITKIKLRFNSANDSLDILGDFLPALTELKLNNSMISSLRDLGTRIRHLRFLWINYSHLRDLSGITAFPQLEELYCSFNTIKELSPLAFHESLSVIDLESNNIDDMEQIEYLDTLPRLESVNLNGNPIMKTKRDDVYKILARIQIVEEDPTDNDPIEEGRNDEENLERLYSLLEDMDIGDLNDIKNEEREVQEQILKEPSEQELLAIQIKEKREDITELGKRPKTAGVMRMKQSNRADQKFNKEDKEQQNQLKQQQLIPDPTSEIGNTGLAYSGNPLKIAQEKKKKHLRDDQKQLDIVQLIRSSRIYK